MCKTSSTKSIAPIAIADPAVPDTALVRRGDIADYLRIHPITWDTLVRRGKAPGKCTPEGLSPRWQAGVIRRWATQNAKHNEWDSGKDTD